MPRLRSAAAAGAASAALTAALLAAGSPASAATSTFKLCAWPYNCAAASVTGTVNWSVNRLDATVVNASYSSVSVTVRAPETSWLLVGRGATRVLTRTFAASTGSVGVTLCVPATDMPNPCVSTTLTRPAA
jgi:hypothetical protein